MMRETASAGRHDPREIGRRALADEETLRLSACASGRARRLELEWPMKAGADRNRPTVEPAPARMHWQQMETGQLPLWEKCRLVFGTLIFYPPSDLLVPARRQVLRSPQRIFVASEPTHCRLFQWLFIALCPQAAPGGKGSCGSDEEFAQEQVVAWLGFNRQQWDWHIRATGLNTYGFVAVQL